MSTLPLAINNYMKALERGVVDVEDHLQACLAGEYILRGLFATNPFHPIVLNPYMGVYDMFDVPTQARLARPRNWDEPEPRRFILEHEGRNYDFPQKHILAVQPHLRRIPGTPCIVNDLSAFRAAWDIFSGGALSSIRNWDNILVAGGSVLACLSSFPSNPSRKELFYIYQSPSYRQSDIDLFLWGMSEDQVYTFMLCLSSSTCSPTSFFHVYRQRSKCKRSLKLCSLRSPGMWSASGHKTRSQSRVCCKIIYHLSVSLTRTTQLSFQNGPSRLL